MASKKRFTQTVKLHRNLRRDGTQAWAYVKGDSHRRLIVREDQFDRELEVIYEDEMTSWTHAAEEEPTDDL